jgi:glycyl-tRNA synthetase
MTFEEVMRLAQQKGFFLRAADSYPNSPAGFWEYGPPGVAFRNKFIELWRRMLVKRDGMVEIDGSQILPKAVFEASGHLEGFTDPFVECYQCHSVHRPDMLIEEKTGKAVPEKLSNEEYDSLLESNKVKCPRCGNKLAGTRRFNMMFRVGVGASQEEAYLRPETCQSIFVDFPLLFKTQRIKLPVGVAQVGRSFRNEIAPRQGVLRQREFLQAEVEVFLNPKNVDSVPRFKKMDQKVLTIITPEGEAKALSVADAVGQGAVPDRLVGYYLALMQSFYEACGLESAKMRFRKLSDEDRAFYSKVAFDLETETSVGWLELVACNYRGDYDLSRHAKVSGNDFTVDDNGEKVLPHVFELSMGVDRSLYAILEAASRTDGKRRFLALKPYLAPWAVGVFPLVSKDGLDEEAAKVLSRLSDDFDAFMDESGSIGKRYARADDIGVPFCVTIDYDTMKDQTVTLRFRDTTTQERLKVVELKDRVASLLKWPTSNQQA